MSQYQVVASRGFLIVVLAVMNGFENEIHSRIIGINAHVILLRYGDEPLRDYDRLADEAEALPEVVGRLADLAQNGPHPPLAALQGASQCLRCGFRAQCFLENGELSPLAVTIQ